MAPVGPIATTLRGSPVGQTTTMMSRSFVGQTTTMMNESSPHVQEQVGSQALLYSRYSQRFALLLCASVAQDSSSLGSRGAV